MYSNLENEVYYEDEKMKKIKRFERREIQEMRR